MAARFKSMVYGVMRFKWAFPAILVGNAIAARLILALSSGVIKVLS